MGPSTVSKSARRISSASRGHRVTLQGKNNNPSNRMTRDQASPTASSKANSTKLLRSPAKLDTTDLCQSNAEVTFHDHAKLTKRLAKSLYYGGDMPSTPRPSFPLTIFAVNAFTSTTLGTNLDTLEFLDLDLASEIGRHACVSPTSLIMTLVYLERLYANNPAYLKSVKPSELFVVSLLVASKFIQDDGEDCGIYNDEWAASARMETKDINKLEIEFLKAIDWNVNISPQEYERVLGNVELQLAKNEVETRGWLTYAEVSVLSKCLLTWNVIWPIVYDYAVKVIVVASITYASLITTLLTSSIVAPQMVTLVSKSLSLQSPQLSLIDKVTHEVKQNVISEIMVTTDNMQLPTQELEDLITQAHISENSTIIAFGNYTNDRFGFGWESHTYHETSKTKWKMGLNGVKPLTMMLEEFMSNVGSGQSTSSLFGENSFFESGCHNAMTLKDHVGQQNFRTFQPAQYLTL